MEGGLLCYGSSQTVVPKEDQERISVYLSYVNNRLIAGNFEYDIDNGQVRYKVFQYCDSALTEDTIMHMLSVVLTMIGQYTPGLQELISDKNLHAKDAYVKFSQTGSGK